MKVTKSVTLDEKTAMKAKEMDNFSLYVRECLEGTMHIKYEAKNRRIRFLLQVIKIARDEGSQSKRFRDAVEVMIL